MGEIQSINNLLELNGSWIERIGWICTCLFALLAWVSPSVASILLYIMAAAMLADIRNFWNTARYDPMFWLFPVVIGFIVFSAIYAYHLLPETKSQQWDAVWRYGHLFLYVPMAYWLKTDVDRVLVVLSVALVGLTAGILMSIDWTLWQDFLRGNRIPINRWGHITIGFYAETALLGLLVIGPRLLNVGHYYYLIIARIAIWLLLLAFFTQSVIFTQSRTVWLSILIVYLPVIGMQLWYLFKSQKLKIARRWLVTAAVPLMTASIFILINSYESISNRLGQEHDDFNKVMALETEGYTEWGFGVRVLLNLYGLQKWKERPIIGWGPGTDFKKYAHAHLHNSYLEVLVRFGIVGAVFFTVVIVFVLRGLAWARARDKLPTDLWLFLAGAFALTALFCITDYRFERMDFRFYWIHLAGISYTFFLHRYKLN